MNKLRFLAWMVIILIAVDFILMVVALFLAKYSVFYVAGGVLVALIIAGYVLKAARKSREEQKKEIGDLPKE